MRRSHLGLRPCEHFLYEYDFTDGWQHDVRVEQIVSLEPGRRYPVRLGGRRGPPRRKTAVGPGPTWSSGSATPSSPSRGGWPRCSGM
ncbi:MAG: IS1096 element passenger TnpR family protein [Chloroflexota bacterium]